MAVRFPEYAEARALPGDEARRVSHYPTSLFAFTIPIFPRSFLDALG